MARSIHIYALVDPVTEEIFYIGQTQKPKARLWHHIYEVSHAKLAKDTPKQNRIRDMLANGYKPEMRTLEIVHSNSNEREEYWYNHFRSQGFRLTNERSLNLRPTYHQLRLQFLESVRKQVDLAKVALELCEAVENAESQNISDRIEATREALANLGDLDVLIDFLTNPLISQEKEDRK